MIFSVVKNLSIDEDIIKLLIGKSARKDYLTYMGSVDVKTAFPKIQSVTGLKLVGEPTEKEKNAWVKDMQVLGA